MSTWTPGDPVHARPAGPELIPAPGIRWGGGRPMRWRPDAAPGPWAWLQAGPALLALDVLERAA